MSPVPLNGTYVVLMPSSRSRRTCATWFAEFVPEPASVTAVGFSFAARTRSANVLNGLSAATITASGV